MLLEAINLVVYCGSVPALKGVSIRVEKEAIVSLIGGNGAGKTTFLRTVSGLQRVTSGEVIFLGKRVSGLPSHEIVKLGVAHVPEGRHVFPRMTVHENILMGSHTRRDKERIRNDIEQVYQMFPKLKERRGQTAGSLSGGEQQMLVFARSLMAGPRILLLDEPSLGLAPLMVKKIAKMILEMRTMRGVGIVLVEQNARLALKISERGYVLENGTVVTQGPSSDLLVDEGVRAAYLGG